MAVALAASYNVNSTASNTTAVTTASFTPAVGEVIVVKMVTEGGASGSPVVWSAGGPSSSAGSLSFTQQVSDNVGGTRCAVQLYTAVVGSGQNVAMTISSPTTNRSGWHSITVERWTGAQLAATPATVLANGSGAPSTTITTAANNSVVSWCNGDWNAVSPTSRAYRSSATEDGLHDKSTNVYVAYYAYQSAATAGSQTVGLTAPTGQAWNVAGIEIQASSSGTNWTQTPTDTTGSTDTTAIDQSKALTDTTGSTDTAAITQGKAVEDTTGLTDSATVAVGHNLTPTADDTGLTDSVVVSVGRGVSSTDTAGLTDSLAIDRGLAPTDTTGLTDTTAIDRGTSITDALGLTDSVVVENGKLVTPTDDGGLTDTTAFAQGKGVTEPAGLTDTTVIDQGKAVTDALGLTDSIAIDIGKLVTQTDTAGVTDSTAFAQGKGQTDDGGVTDSVAFAQGKVTQDLAGMSDAVVLELFRGIVAADTTGLTDSVVVDHQVITASPNYYHGAAAGVTGGGAATGTATIGGATTTAATATLGTPPTAGGASITNGQAGADLP